MNVMDCEASASRARAHLRRLARIRWLAIGTVGALVYAAHTALEIRIPLVPLVQTLCVYALVNAATTLRLQAAWPRFWSRHLPVTEHELGAQLLVDIAVLSSALYFTGGAINPFAACYLLLVLYASVALPPRLAWTVAVISMLAYAGLHLFRIPLPVSDAVSADRTLNYSAHFAIYLALAALVAGYGVRLSEMRRLYLARAQADAQKEARERYLVGLAALSAGTAHQMSTPLSTMAIVVGDLRESGEVPPQDWKQSIDMLWGQIQICRRSLEAMARSADVDRLGKIESVRAEQFVLDVAERFRALHPKVQLKLRCARLEDALTLSSDHTLPQAVLNFLGNAADASPHSVEMRAGLIDELLLAIEVLDRGPGIPAALRERIGKGLLSTKESGRGNGSGVLIACAAVERFGGTIHISDRRGGGTRVQIELPLFRPRAATTGEDDDYRRLGIA
jgi:two-component system sensor histidine kinase RegB